MVPELGEWASSRRKRQKGFVQCGPGQCLALGTLCPSWPPALRESPLPPSGPPPPATHTLTDTKRDLVAPPLGFLDGLVLPNATILTPASGLPASWIGMEVVALVRGRWRRGLFGSDTRAMIQPCGSDIVWLDEPRYQWNLDVE